MADQDAVAAAVAELYAADPDGFVERRRELAAEARRRGDAEAAKQIATLRRPTRSAWTTNALAHRDPTAFEQVADLAAQLRDAERRLDGPQLRELSRQRRALIDEITRKAFAATGQRTPSAALREEVAGTLTAAFADPEVAEAVQSGTLVRAAQWDGFGTASRPELALVPPPAPSRVAGPEPRTSSRVARPEPPAPEPRAGTSAGGKRAGVRSKQPAQKAGTQTASRSGPPQQATPAVDKAAERERNARIAKANRELAAAERALSAAQADEERCRQQLRELDERLAAARRDLDQARQQLRQAKVNLRETQRRRDQAYRP